MVQSKFLVVAKQEFSSLSFVCLITLSGLVYDSFISGLSEHIPVTFILIMKFFDRVVMQMILITFYSQCLNIAVFFANFVGFFYRKNKIKMT